MPESPLSAYREFLKDTIRQQIDFSQSDQHQGAPPPPPLEKPYPSDAARLDLPQLRMWKGIAATALTAAIGDRQSRRNFSPAPLTLDELSFLPIPTGPGCRGTIYGAS